MHEETLRPARVLVFIKESIWIQIASLLSLLGAILAGAVLKHSRDAVLCICFGLALCATALFWSISLYARSLWHREGADNTWHALFAWLNTITLPLAITVWRSVRVLDDSQVAANNLSNSLVLLLIPLTVGWVLLATLITQWRMRAREEVGIPTTRLAWVRIWIFWLFILSTPFMAFMPMLRRE